MTANKNLVPPCPPIIDELLTKMMDKDVEIHTMVNL